MFSMTQAARSERDFLPNHFSKRSMTMWIKAWIGLVVLGMSLSIGEVTVNADDKDEKTDSKDKKEVAFPELPKGAGKIDKDAPKTFSETKSGLKYRILRKGEGKK